MSQQLKRVFLALALVGLGHSASAFSLLGPYESWQVPEISYNLPGDIGGPMNVGEEYRWNIKTIVYGFDSSFIEYFGEQGKAAVEQAIAIFNNLPSASQMSSSLAEFPLNTTRVNYQASALQLLDLKSTALTALMEEMGVADAERYVWTLRARQVVQNNSATNYLVIMRNFDPVSWGPSRYVNGTLYTYYIGETADQDDASIPNRATAVETPVDPLASAFTSVASGPLGSGQFYSGLTRDDVGALRYLLRTNNFQWENLTPGTTATSNPDCPWCPYGGTNGAGTNLVVDLAVRPGVEKITFQAAQYDPLTGLFRTVTNTFTDTYVTNSTLKTQTVERLLAAPDILFSAEDLGVNNRGIPLATWARTTTTGWANNSALNSQAALAGPGVIQPRVTITFNKLGPYFFNVNPGFLDEATSFPGFVWGSFDGTTNSPVIYPVGSSLLERQQEVLGGL